MKYEIIANTDQEISSYPTAAEVQQYLVSYADHFRLGPLLRLNTTVDHIVFNDVRHQWAIQIEGEKDVQYFDKLIIAIGGLTSLPNIPKIQGLKHFKGTALHSRAFKKSVDFKGKRVMVVGFGNTAADTATALANVAEKVYIAHRNGARVVGALRRRLYLQLRPRSATSQSQRQASRPCFELTAVRSTKLDHDQLSRLWFPDI